ncbi:hypothetical protein ACLOJK_017773 [Asimina triloba]
MASKSPVFPMPQPQHFSDYGFDPQIDYFQVSHVSPISTSAVFPFPILPFLPSDLQVLEEARKHKRESRESRSLDSLHFKLQKPISKEESKKAKKKKKRWWRNALQFWKWKWSEEKLQQHGFGPSLASDWPYNGRSASSPVYGVGEIGSWTPSWSRPSSGPLAGTWTPTRKGDLEIPYLSLREMNAEAPQRISTSSMPIYLVT